jgi:hypothetical protein
VGGYLEWTHARQLIRVERVVTNPETGEAECKGNRFFVTNLVRGKLKPEGWLTLCRVHWRCENEGHWTSDVFWNEDARRTPWTTKPEAVFALAALRMIAQNILAVFRSMTRRHWDPRPPRWQDLIDLVRALLRIAMPAKEPALSEPGAERLPATDDRFHPDHNSRTLRAPPFGELRSPKGRKAGGPGCRG